MCLQDHAQNSAGKDRKLSFAIPQVNCALRSHFFLLNCIDHIFIKKSKTTNIYPLKLRLLLIYLLFLLFKKCFLKRILGFHRSCKNSTKNFLCTLHQTSPNDVILDNNRIIKIRKLILLHY